MYVLLNEVVRVQHWDLAVRKQVLRRG